MRRTRINHKFNFVSKEGGLISLEGLIRARQLFLRPSRVKFKPIILYLALLRERVREREKKREKQRLVRRLQLIN